MYQRLVWCAIAILLVPIAARAQEKREVVPGARVRITENGPDSRGRMQGTIVTRSADSISLKPDSGPTTTTIATRRITTLELSRGMHSQWLAGLGYGFLIGAGTGVVAGLIACGNDKSCRSSGTEMNTPQFYSMALGVTFGLGGGLLGALIGSGAHKEEWEEAPAAGWRLALLPSSQGGVAFRFGRVF